jgi:hypothetical protein
VTPEELSALPEREEYRLELLPDGTTVRHRIVPRFASYSPQADDVILFHDKDGSWVVEYHLEGGPYKRRAML